MSKLEVYVSQDGKSMFIIAHCSEKFSTGVMVLEPSSELPPHKRPCVEELYQISGKCEIRFSDGRIITLEEGSHIQIEPGREHVHANPFEERSITQWKAHGDIRSIIEKIRETYKRVI